MKSNGNFLLRCDLTSITGRNKGVEYRVRPSSSFDSPAPAVPHVDIEGLGGGVACSMRGRVEFGGIVRCDAVLRACRGASRVVRHLHDSPAVIPVSVGPV